jgi:chemotaxis signal transduction protein
MLKNIERTGLMEQAQNFFFIVYLLKQNGSALEVRCRGCREIVIPDYKTPTHIRGMIEFEAVLIPVIDPSIYFYNKSTQITNSACILVIEHSNECKNRRTGILVEDIEEIMNLAAGSYKHGALLPSTFNMRFVLEMSKNIAAIKILSDTHLAFELCERQKQEDEDFAAFQKIISRSTNSYDSNFIHPLKRYPTPRTVSI